MFGRGKSTTGLAKPKRLHSLDYLKYLHGVMVKNPTVNASNCATLVEVLRLITEILIWGDQHEPAIMDFFLEKNMLAAFLAYIRQGSAEESYSTTTTANNYTSIAMQLLQSMNILFENLNSRTAVYYLMSNNHANEIITHPFTFDDEEQNKEFDLYTEAIKLYDHPESMVRIAVRTITLNIHKVNDEAALAFIYYHVALPYISRLIWSLGSIGIDIAGVLETTSTSGDQSSSGFNQLVKLDDLIPQQIDQLQYLNDLFSLGLEPLNDLLCDQLVRHLFLPLHVRSLFKLKAGTAATGTSQDTSLRLPFGVACFALVHAFSSMTHPLLCQLIVESLASDRLLAITSSTTDSYLQSPHHESTTLMEQGLSTASIACSQASSVTVGKRLGVFLDTVSNSSDDPSPTLIDFKHPSHSLADSIRVARLVRPDQVVEKIKSSSDLSASTSSQLQSHPLQTPASDLIDLAGGDSSSHVVHSTSPSKLPLQGRPFLRTLFRSLDASSDSSGSSDQDALLVLLLLSTLLENKGLDAATRSLIFLNPDPFIPDSDLVITKLVNFIHGACRNGSQVRVVTFYLALRLLLRLSSSSSSVQASNDDHVQSSYLTDEHLALLLSAKEQATMILRSYFTCDAIFLDLFESEIKRLQHTHPTSVTSSYPRNLLLDLASDQRVLLNPVQLGSAGSNQLPLTSSFTSSAIYSNASWYWPNSATGHTQRAIDIFLLLLITVDQVTRLRQSPAVTSNDFDLEQVCSSSQLTTGGGDQLTFDSLIQSPTNADKAKPTSPSSSSSPRPGQRLDLSSEILIRCSVESKATMETRFLVNHNRYVVLVEPDSKQLGCGVVTFAGPLQDLEAFCDPADSRCLRVTINSPGFLAASSLYPSMTSSSSMTNRSRPAPLFQSRFLFDDHIRCMTAKQMLHRGQEAARRSKLRKIAGLLDFSPQRLRDLFGGGGSSHAAGTTADRSHQLTANARLSRMRLADHSTSASRQPLTNKSSPSPTFNPASSSTTTTARLKSGELYSYNDRLFSKTASYELKPIPNSTHHANNQHIKTTSSHPIGSLGDLLQGPPVASSKLAPSPPNHHVRDHNPVPPRNNPHTESKPPP